MKLLLWYGGHRIHENIWQSRIFILGRLDQTFTNVNISVSNTCMAFSFQMLVHVHP